jgi:MFS family permease
VGVLLNLSMGLFVNRVPAVAIVIVSSVLAAISPLLMAVIDPSTTYWANAFVAQLLQPVSCDCLFTVGLIVITEVFPRERHSLAGAVFNTMTQFGTALGLAVMQIISTLETKKHEADGAGSREDALLKGYRASFWAMFAMMLACAVVGGLGLRKTGKVGLKKD